MMHRIKTSRFGPLEIDEDCVIHFPEGLLGFSDCRDYIILEHKPDSPFCWMQSIDTPELAFVLSNPFMIKSDYLEALSPDEMKLLPEMDHQNVIILTIATIPPGDARKMTVNLLGPLIINTESRQGRQAVLANSGYSHCYAVFSS
jgi:flagellar assembly factor FliW